MPIKFQFENPDKGVWVLLRQVHNLVSKCEDQVFSEYDLTTEQHGVLMAIKHIDGPVRPTDIARWLDRSVNSVSMIIDRMVKAGLVRRVRDRKDRREVHVTNTSKGQDALKPANLAGLEVIRKILSPLSYEDRLTFLNLLETIKYEIIEYLSPGVDIEEIKRNELKQATNLTKWLSEYGLPSTPEAKRQGGEKRKTT